jgi:hypothetical protein
MVQTFSLSISGSHLNITNNDSKGNIRQDEMGRLLTTKIELTKQQSEILISIGVPVVEPFIHPKPTFGQ